MRNHGAGRTDTIHARKAIDAELEHGFRVHVADANSMMFGARATPLSPIMPDAGAVWAAYVNESDVLDSGSFEDWARDLGYEPDSRTAESIWKICIENSLKIRAAIGESLLSKLRDLAREL